MHEVRAGGGTNVKNTGRGGGCLDEFSDARKRCKVHGLCARVGARESRRNLRQLPRLNIWPPIYSAVLFSLFSLIYRAHRLQSASGGHHREHHISKGPYTDADVLQMLRTVQTTSSRSLHSSVPAPAILARKFPKPVSQPKQLRRNEEPIRFEIAQEEEQPGMFLFARDVFLSSPTH